MPPAKGGSEVGELARTHHEKSTCSVRNRCFCVWLPDLGSNQGPAD